MRHHAILLKFLILYALDGCVHCRFTLLVDRWLIMRSIKSCIHLCCRHPDRSYEWISYRIFWRQSVWLYFRIKPPWSVRNHRNRVLFSNFAQKLIRINICLFNTSLCLGVLHFALPRETIVTSPSVSVEHWSLVAALGLIYWLLVSIVALAFTIL